MVMRTAVTGDVRAHGLVRWGPRPAEHRRRSLITAGRRHPHVVDVYLGTHVPNALAYSEAANGASSSSGTQKSRCIV